MPMHRSEFRQPQILAQDEQVEQLHVFFLHSPIALIMSLMIIDAFHIPPNKILGIRQRDADTSLVHFEVEPLLLKGYDRYFNRLSGRHLAALRLRRRLESAKKRFVVYAAWYYSEIEEMARSSFCDGVIIYEEGQLSFHAGKSYTDCLLNTWRFRKRRLKSGTTDFWFREDAAAYIAISAEAFPSVPDDCRYVLENFEAAADRYKPLLCGVKSIGLLPAPRRLSKDGFWHALELLVNTISGEGVIRLHPGYKFEKYYSLADFENFILRASGGRISLCPEEAIIELEMMFEAKVLYGAQTSLKHYASKFGSQFRPVEFSYYEKPVI